MLGLLLFTFLRLERDDLIVGAVDSVGVLSAAMGFAYVYRTHNIFHVGRLLAGLALTGMVINVFVLGPADIYFLYPV